MRTKYARPNLRSMSDSAEIERSALTAVQQWHARKFTVESPMLGYGLSTRCVARASFSHDPKPAISIARGTESEALRIHENEFRRQGFLCDLHRAGNDRGRGGGEAEAKRTTGNSSLISCRAISRRISIGSSSSRTRRRRSSRSRSAIITTTSIICAGWKKKTPRGGRNGIRQAKRHPGRADRRRKNLSDQTHRGTDQSSFRKGGRDEVQRDRLRGG